VMSYAERHEITDALFDLKLELDVVLNNLGHFRGGMGTRGNGIKLARHHS
jgi:hypothetical protein